MNKLKNKVAIVTGASKGIGAAIATYFAAVNRLFTETKAAFGTLDILVNNAVN